MVQEQFIEFDEESGIGDLLFVNMNHPIQYRFYRRRDRWDECYMVELCSKSEDYHLYWGHNVPDRGMIDPITLLLPPYPEVEWKRVDFNHYFPFNLTQIVESIEKNLSEQK